MRPRLGNRTFAVLAACGLVAAAACGDDDGDADAQSAPAKGPSGEALEPDPDLGELSLSLTEIGRFTEPIAVESRPEDPSLFVAEKEGRVLRMTVQGEGLDRTYTTDPEPVVDITDQVISGPVPDERGLLDIEFSPDGKRLYLSYSQDPDGATRVISYDYVEPGPDPSATTTSTEAPPADQGGAAATTGATVGEDSLREILTVPQPYPNHNGGNIVFGPDGYLYVGLGDGGAGGDPEGNGQDTSTLLGSIVRIDPESTAKSGEPYAIPEDNPFADGGEGEPEVWLYGVRNPWRFSFDAVTGDLWVGDVGQNEREEINMLPAEDGAGRGANLGWNEMEGSQPFEGGSNPSGAVLPVFDYPIPDEGCAVTGGYVYSGKAIPGLDTVYLFGDYCNPVLRGLSVDNGQVTRKTDFEDIQVESLVSFGEDNEGEVYLVSQTGPVYRLDP